MKDYLIRLITHDLQTKFIISSKEPINTAENLTPFIIDYLGKNDIEWEPYPLGAYLNGYYITYEEVNDGRTKHHGVVRKEGRT